MPRKLTWERSESFRLASPPASLARATEAASSAREATAPNFVSLETRDQAFVSQVRIHNPPYFVADLRSESSLRKVFGTAAIRTLVRPSAFRRVPRIEFSLIPPVRTRPESSPNRDLRSG